MEFDIIATILLMAIVIIVGISIVDFMGQSLQAQIPVQVKGVYDKFVSVLLQQSPYNSCASYGGQKLSIQDFEVLLQSDYNGQCGGTHTDVVMSFSASPDDISKIALKDGIADNGALIFYNISQNTSLGVGAIVVYGDSGSYPLKLNDKVEVWLEGSPKGDLHIKVVEKGCDPYDDVCDPSCTNMGICDPVCDNGQQYNIPCNLACIVDDVGVINQTSAALRISAGKCNPDCFSNQTNPAHAYDPGCIYKKITVPNYATEFGGICDPNSNGVSDGLCDPDCAASKNICDPDCNGTAYYPGNPQGLNDTKCFVCDGTCNGYCSPACDPNALPGDVGFDPDCFRTLNTSFFCSGDGMCDTGRGENCANSMDCPKPGLACSDLGQSCCSSASNSDIYGCSNTTGVAEGGVCTCGSQCSVNLTCDSTSHCCPSDEKWNGTGCATSCPRKIDNPSCTPTSPSDELTPQNVRVAYDVEPFIKAGFNGTGQNIILVTLCNDPTIATDLNTFDQAFGLPPATVNVVGTSQCVGDDECEAAGEASLDVEWSHAIAPGATLYEVVLPSMEFDPSVILPLIHQTGAKNPIVSMSFGGAGYDANFQQVFDQGASEGMTFIASDGDWCAYNNGRAGGGVDYPAGFPSVLAIGGTQSLSLNSNCQYSSTETAWNCAYDSQSGFYWGTSGNPGDTVPLPSYQQGISAITNGKRAFSDVSLDTSQRHPVYNQYQESCGGGASLVVGGTSDAAPEWAGIIAILRSAGVKNLQGNINPIIYQIGENPALAKEAFHDITSGNNIVNGQGYSAQSGWDYPTGFGSPDVVGLCEALTQ